MELKLAYYEDIEYKLLFIHLNKEIYVKYKTTCCNIEKNNLDELDPFKSLANKLKQEYKLNNIHIVFTPCDKNHPLEYCASQYIINYLTHKKLKFYNFQWKDLPIKILDQSK